jgi:hypothetical protein
VLVAGLMLSGSAARAGPGSAPPGDSARVEARKAAARLGRFETPRWVMLRSLAFPGWGQMHNRAWLKAALIGGGETALLAGLVADDRRLRQLSGEAARAHLDGDRERENAAVEANNALLSRFVAREWLLGGIIAYALMDAYVDAHFRDFKLEFEHDPALPGGLPPSGEARLFLRWTF